jgi:arsenate reductase (glutaredoxin)
VIRLVKPPRLTAIPLAAWERDGVVAALRKADLPADDVTSEGPLFWRFETLDLTPVGFGGLEIHGDEALLRSVVTLPPLRGRGIGQAIATALEAEAGIAGCRAVWLITVSSVDLFERLGYAACRPDMVPQAIRASAEFTALRSAPATIMTKRLA